jgi:hypothetical protein
VRKEEEADPRAGIGLGFHPATLLYSRGEKNERPRFVLKHDPTAGKFGFTGRRVVVAPIIPLD